MNNILNCTPGKSFQCGGACIPNYKKCISKFNELDSGEKVKIIENFRKYIDRIEQPIIEEGQEDIFAIEKSYNNIINNIKKEKDRLKEIGETSSNTLKMLEDERDKLEEDTKFKDKINEYYENRLINLLNNPSIGSYSTFEEFISDKVEDKYNTLPIDSFLLMAQIYAEKRLEYNRQKGKIGDDIEDYNKIIADNIEYISRNLGRTDINKLIDLFVNDYSNKDKKKLKLDTANIKNELSNKVEQTISEKEFRKLSDTIRWDVLNNYDDKPPSSQSIAKVSWSLREALKSIEDKETLDLVNKVFSDTAELNNNDLEKIKQLFESYPQDLDPRDGSILLRIGVINRLANKLQNDDFIIELAESDFFSVLGTNDKGNSNKLYLGDVKGDDNKLFKSNSPFGKKIRDVIINSNLKRILDKKNKKLLKSEKELIPVYINPDGFAYDDKYKGDNPQLLAKKRFISLLSDYTKDSIDNDAPAILKELKNNLPKDKNFNVNYMGPGEFDNFLNGLAKGSLNNNDNSEGDKSLLNEELIRNDAESLYNKYLIIKNDEVELEKFLQNDFLTFMSKLGFAKTDAAEFLPVFFASATGKSGAVLDLYDGNPFPFADAIVESNNPGEYFLTSVKYGKSGGVPADANALTNLLAPQYTNLIGRPGGINKDGWDYLKAENSPIEYTNQIPGIKIKEGKTKEDILKHLSDLSGHFNYNELERLAKSDPKLEKIYNKLNLIADLLANGDEDSQKLLAVIFNTYNIDKMEKNFNAENIKIKGALGSAEAQLALGILRNRYRENYPNLSDEEVDNEIKKLTPKEINRSLGFNIKIDSNGKIIPIDYYENYNLQMGLSHIALAIWEQDIFNNFFIENDKLKPAENHPDRELKVSASKKENKDEENSKLMDRLNQLGILDSSGNFNIEELNIIFPGGIRELYKLIFSNRTDAGSSSRASSAGTQYKFGGQVDLFTLLSNLMTIYS